MVSTARIQQLPLRRGLNQAEIVDEFLESKFSNFKFPKIFFLNLGNLVLHE